MNRLFFRFLENWQNLFAANGDSPILLGVSGGVDSMVMAELFRCADMVFGVAHCNFGLRGADADFDEQFVRDWCARYNVPFFSIRFPTLQRAAEWKTGIQETARNLRYNWFTELMQQHGYKRLATAHNANDNAETLLINLFRGTGIHGLHGISYNTGTIIRPLLFAQRSEIAEWAKEQSVGWREDASNQKDDYLRNAIRLHILPQVAQHLPQVVANLNNTITRLAEAEQLYNIAVERELKSLKENRGKDIYIPVNNLKHKKPLATICYELLKPYGFGPHQTEHIISMISADTGRYISSATHRLIRHRDFLVVAATEEGGADLLKIDSLPFTVVADGYKYTFLLQDKPTCFPEGNDVLFASAECVSFPLTFRKWKTGDYLYPMGMRMKKKKVSRLLIDLKIPIHEKERIWVLESGKRIIWVAGVRTDERVKVTDTTSKVLAVTRIAITE